MPVLHNIENLVWHLRNLIMHSFNEMRLIRLDKYSGNKGTEDDKPFYIAYSDTLSMQNHRQ